MQTIMQNKLGENKKYIYNLKGYQQLDKQLSR